MQWTPKLRSLVENYLQLVVTKEHRALTAAETEQFHLLRDVILETGVAIESEVNRFARRSPRAALHLEVAFSTPNAAAKAMTREIGTGGLALVTDHPLPKGTMVSIELRVPVWPRPLRALAEVVWSKSGAVGLAFRGLGEEEATLVKDLVAEHASLLDRIQGALTRGTPGDAKVAVASNVLLRLYDPLLLDTATAILGIRGHHVATELQSPLRPDVLAVDAPNLAEAVAAHPNVPVVLVNASGPESLVRGLSQLRPRAYVKRPAAPQAIADAVKAALSAPVR